MGKKIKDVDIITNLIMDSAATYIGGMMFTQHIRDYVKKYPALKQSVVSSLEKLIEELKQD